MLDNPIHFQNLSPSFPAFTGIPKAGSKGTYQGTSADNLWQGSARGDACYGWLGHDQLFGDGGNDYLAGEGGNDQLHGGTGHDILDGGTGHDTLDGGAGTDTAYFLGSARARVDLSLAGAQNTGRGQDVLISVESAVGGMGNDVLKGSAVRNVLIGNEGRDVLEGRAGNDVLTGGQGKDFFDFRTALHRTKNVDTITDFSVADDTIRLDNAVFTKLKANGALKSGFFHAGTKAKDKNDYVVYDQAKGKLYYDADGSGGEAQVLFAKVKAGLALTAADFLVI